LWQIVRLRALPGLCVVVAVLALAGTASAATGPGWTRGATVDPATPTGISCPSTSLCVAVDARGDVLVSAAPRAGAPAWRVSVIDPGTALSGVSCPSLQLCVAVDRAGQVLTSTDPASVNPAWPAGLVAPDQWAGVSCPTVSLCVAAGGQDIAVSTNPAGGSSTWTVVHNADQAIDYECGKYNSGSSTACPPQSLTSVSCPTPRVCEAVDDDGGATVSTDPSSPTGWPAIVGLESGNGGSNMVACQTGSLCLHDCALGAGASPCDGRGGYDAGEVIATDPTRPQAPQAQTISPSALIGLWCAPVACFAASGADGLLGSSDPAGPDAWWQSLLPPLSMTAPASDGVAAVACPSRSLCLGLTSGGALVAGPPPATITAVRVALRLALSHPPRVLSARTLLRAGGYRYRCRFPAAGRLTVSAYRPSTGIVVAHATHTYQEPAAATIELSLTHAGRRLLAHGTLQLAMRATFAPSGGEPIHATGHRITIG
jgi:hypothetical protein